MSKYKVKHTSIMHNGKLCKEGSVIELTDAQAAKLADFVVLVPATKPKAKLLKSFQKNLNQPSKRKVGGVNKLLLIQKVMPKKFSLVQCTD